MTETTKKTGLLTTKNLLALAAIVLVIIAITQLVVQQRLSHQQVIIQEEIENKLVSLNELDQQVVNGTVSQPYSEVLNDCTQPIESEFQDLLNRLNTNLSSVELERLRVLLVFCGQQDSLGRIIMSELLAREVAALVSQLEQLNALTTFSVDEQYSLTAWQELAREVGIEAGLYGDLVSQQEAIIEALLAGESRQSQVITDILSQVAETQENIVLARTKANNAREVLSSE
jgi:hypothetical protein